MRELRATYEIEKQSTLILTEKNLAMSRTLSSIRLQAAMESADHESIMASKDGVILVADTQETRTSINYCDPGYCAART
jgi:hypothetical protein